MMQARRNSEPRGSSVIMLAFGATIVLGVLGATNVMWTDLKERRAFRSLQETTAREANQSSVELLGKLFEKNLIVAFYVPSTPPTVAAPPVVPAWEDCSAPSPPASCSAASTCATGPNCKADDPSTDGAVVPGTPTEVQNECKKAICADICSATNCTTTCNAAVVKPNNCATACGESTQTACKATCSAGLPSNPDCKMCVPDPDTKEGCEVVSKAPGAPSLPLPNPIPPAPPDDPPFEATKGIFLTYDNERLTALPHGANFDPGYLNVARLNRKVLNPAKLSNIQQAADQQLSNGAYVGNAACVADPSACFTQSTSFGNVVNSSGATPGSIEVVANTEVPTSRLTSSGVRTRARITIPTIGPAPLPHCTLTASPSLVWSHKNWAGRLYTTLILTTRSNPSFPGLITRTNLAGVTMGPRGGARVVPYPYGAYSYPYFATVTGPGGTSACSTTVSSACYPRAPVCLPHVCWYPIDNFPRCAGWIVCHEGQPCWPRGETLGCFDPNTNIAVSEKELRKVWTISTGNVLWNPVTKRTVAVKRRIVGPEPLPLVEIGYGDKVIRLTTQHPVITQRGLVQAEHLRETDSLQGEDLAFHRVTHLKRGPTPATKNSATVINLEIDTPSEDPEDHYLLADGIVVGDYFLQQELARGHGKKTNPKPATIAAKKR